LIHTKFFAAFCFKNSNFAQGNEKGLFLTLALVTPEWWKGIYWTREILSDTWLFVAWASDSYSAGQEISYYGTWRFISLLTKR